MLDFDVSRSQFLFEQSSGQAQRYWSGLALMYVFSLVQGWWLLQQFRFGGRELFRSQVSFVIFIFFEVIVFRYYWLLFIFVVEQVILVGFVVVLLGFYVVVVYVVRVGDVFVIEFFLLVIVVFGEAGGEVQWVRVELWLQLGWFWEVGVGFYGLFFGRAVSVFELAQVLGQVGVMVRRLVCVVLRVFFGYWFRSVGRSCLVIFF